jgi:hypothetical protein
MAYVGWASNYPYGSATISSSNAISGDYLPGYAPSNTNGQLSNFTVYNTGATTEYYASFIIQQQLASGSNPAASPTLQVANNVLTVPVYSLTCAVDAANQILYYSATADLILNTPTNPSSSVYNIFLNLNLFNAASGIQSSSCANIPYFENYTYNTTDPVCDVLLTLSSMGSTSVSSIFTLTSQDIAANSCANALPIGGTDTSGTQLTTATNGDTLFTINIPISSVFPQISTPGILYRLKVELLGYTS